MDKAVLVMFPLQAGGELLSSLDNPPVGESPFVVKAAFWLYRPEADDWRLYLAAPLVDELGPLESYKRVRLAIARTNGSDGNPWNELTLSNISVISPKDKLVKALKRIAGPGAQNVRVRGGFVEEISLEEAYVYRLDSAMAA